MSRNASISASGFGGNGLPFEVTCPPVALCRQTISRGLCAGGRHTRSKRLGKTLRKNVHYLARRQGVYRGESVTKFQDFIELAPHADTRGRISCSPGWQ